MRIFSISIVIGGKITTEDEKENSYGLDGENIEKELHALKESSPCENKTDLSSIDHLIDPYFSKFSLKVSFILLVCFFLF